MLGARAPRHVYSAFIVNHSRRPCRVTVTYTMPHGGIETSVVDIDAGSSMAVEQKHVYEDQATLTGRISTLNLEGGNTLSEPFKNVFSPTKNYKFQISEDGFLE